MNSAFLSPQRRRFQHEGGRTRSSGGNTMGCRLEQARRAANSSKVESSDGVPKIVEQDGQRGLHDAHDLAKIILVAPDAVERPASTESLPSGARRWAQPMRFVSHTGCPLCGMEPPSRAVT